MSRTPEGKVKDACSRVLRELGVWYFFPATGGYGRSGVPDIIACYRGRFVSIECKADGNKPTALQLREMETIAAAGGLAFVVSSVEEARVLPTILSALDTANSNL